MTALGNMGRGRTATFAAQMIAARSGCLKRSAHAASGGVYLLVCELRRARRLAVGSLGRLTFPSGFYVYVGSAARGLDARVARHMRRRKRRHWHIDALTAVADRKRAFLIRTGRDLECRLAAAVARIADAPVPRFGSSDCGCGSHLFRFASDPARDPRFVRLLPEASRRIAGAPGAPTVR